MRSTSLLLVLACAACAGSGAWPGRPSRYHGVVKKPVSGQDASAVEKVAGESYGKKYPPKTYWIAAPDWQPIKSLAGVVTGRRTANAVMAKVIRYDGSREKWPDMCAYEEIAIKQDARDGSPTDFGPPTLDRVLVRGEVDCSVYDAAPRPEDARGEAR